MSQDDHVGFTGSRHGMSHLQTITVTNLLRRRLDLKSFGPTRYLHHGGCIGADEQVHKIALELGYRIWLHPPIDQHRYFTKEGECAVVDRPFSFSGRNQRIAIESKILIGTPRHGSVGTWNCLQHMASLGKPRFVVNVYGKVLEES